LHTNSRDEALSLPTEDAVQIALRTQQIIAHESGVADTMDPLAGSYLIESWTDEIEKRATEYIAKIDALGGALRAIEQGYVQREIQESAYRWQLAVDQGHKIVVGVNRFRVEEDASPGGEGEFGLLRLDPAVGERQIARLKVLRNQRNREAVSAALSNLEAAARGDGNLMPVILEAVEVYATLGEICNVMRKAFGEYQTFTSF
jgi:methylmalonyl-CoA mutase N-terminal domain/subunit